jgi:energy-coupling factor transporter ATP-binding protein EcfA2
VPTLHSILKADITREIEGVVKADDHRRIGQEIREYVVTTEIAKMLRRFFEGYQEAIARRRQGGTDIYPYNGVWISGYFGSGKSHLLKILAYLLSDSADEELRQVFLGKIEDAFLRGAVETAFQTPAASVLFNIDQQADAETSDQTNLILLVFERVFNRAVGYCDDDPVVADLERDLDTRGEYDAFRETFRSVNGEEWTDRRDSVMTLDRDLFAAAWSAFKGADEADADTLLDRYESGRSLTAEKLAQRIKQWLDRQEDPHHRLNFFVDEVGQFVAGRRDRMLNLQTVAESMATICDNRAWVFVTSQEDIDAVIGDATQEQRQDFSRITARFEFKLPLTSANVEEVIQKRLLAKTDEGHANLTEYFAANADHLRTVFHFGKGVKEVRFKHADHFALSYPFLAYQYYYLQEALRGLSSHNAFTGRHVSRGERSMLEVFQDVGIKLKDVEVGRFATFDQMFDGIRQTLQGGLLNQVSLAEDQISDALSVRIIKVLLMLKYVKDLPTTVEHITTLLLETVDQDRAQLRSQVQTALDTLEFQSYVQRNGEVYEYLTDREQDVEQEIKNTPVEYAEIRRLVGEITADRILRGNKVTFEDNDQPYAYSVFVDDEQLRKQSTDLALRVITHLHGNAGDIQTILNQAMGRKELLVVLDVPKQVDTDLRLYFQTRTYLNQNAGSEDPQQRTILAEKSARNAERESRLRESIIPGLIEGAALYVADRKVETSIRDPRQRLTAALQELIRVSYPNLRMLSGRYTESGLKRILFPEGDDVIFSGDAVGMGEDESEMQAFLQRQQQAGAHTSVITLKDSFSGGQYGWYEWAILGVAAKLFARDAVEIVEGNHVLDRAEVLARLTKAHGHESITVRLNNPIDSTIVNRLATLYQEFFNRPATVSGGKELVIAFKKGLNELRGRLVQLAAQTARYPFVSQLHPVIERYEALIALEVRALADTLSEEEEEILLEKLETVDPLLAFLDGAGRTGFDRIRDYLQTNRDNFAAVGQGESLGKLEGYLETARPWAGNATKEGLDRFTEASAEIASRLEESRTAAKGAIDAALETLADNETLSQLPEEARGRLVAPIRRDLSNRIAATVSLATLQNIAEIQVPRTLQEVREEIQKEANPEKKVEYARPGEKKIAFAKSELVTPEDVDAYVEELRKQWRSLVESGKRIGL